MFLTRKPCAVCRDATHIKNMAADPDIGYVCPDCLPHAASADVLLGRTLGIRRPYIGFTRKNANL